jgi:hypothetical protein
MESEKQIKLTRKGKPDRRVSESGPKNIQKALEKRKEIFEEYNKKKKEDEGKEYQIEDSDSSSSESDEDLFITKTKRKEKVIEKPIIKQEDTFDRFNKLENLMAMLAEQQLKSKPKKKRDKKTIIQISQPKKTQEDKLPTEMEKHLKYKILNF